MIHGLFHQLARLFYQSETRWCLATSHDVRDSTSFARRKVKEHHKQEQDQTRPSQVSGSLSVIHPRICSCGSRFACVFDIVKGGSGTVGVVLRKSYGGAATVASS